MDIPAPDPAKLLDHWMEWERGEIAPGELMKQFKMGGMRTVLEQIVAGEWQATPSSAETVGDLLDQ